LNCFLGGERLKRFIPYTKHTMETTTLTIKEWAEDDRPREKLRDKGCQALSDAELLAIIIGSGTRKLTAVDIAKLIIDHAGNNLNELGKKSVKDLTKEKGIGEARAITIVAALELGRRRQATQAIDRPQITGSADAFNLIGPVLADLPHEEFWVLFMNRANRLISREQISSGGVSGTVVDTKIIFKRALEQLASSMIVVHNHPSGNRSPSQADIEITKKIVAAGKLLEIQVLDHLIVCGNQFYSFADEGML
jgi:DNA repair protein RadC